ncbi:transposase [Pelosinus baikalensis]|uniref:Transposase n=1 Tax=Pelosinus baikalensis TaxID=2892015 RepID=A0ABS8HXJ4_9FIRM|nr:transposase [Pelosinus baikalensis]
MPSGIFLQFSDVQVIEHIQVNLAHRWFLRLNIDEEPPDDSTISYFRGTRIDLHCFKRYSNVWLTNV